MSSAAYNPVRADARKADRRSDRLARQAAEHATRSPADSTDRTDSIRRSGEDGSDTEVDDALITDDEKQWETVALERGLLARRPSRTSRVLGAVRRHRWMVDTGLLVVILGLLVLLQLEVRQRPARWQVGGDYMKAGPIFRTKVVKWEADEAFVPPKDADFASNTTLATWNTLMPQGTGWHNTEAATTFFTTTMTHQLHCILMMGRIYTALRMNAMPSPDLPADYHSHYLHCIDYLRQAAMCAGDVAVEAHEPTDASDNGALDGGWSGHHVCKDYGQITSYLESQIRDGVRTVLPIDD
ncbi:uncharacterized protein SPSK_06367 [Sporothrix schenckii 1099-18]|uniref:Oxidase ustYa n=2 Tax=Sporothrix schenckii TaxID=29908 RepID=U7PI16_SPOS1|nr:uncharacterized protein SPSK_06367 [Sporothrix schenckii 1099-18]ERS95177.1 hypothetical protein HMPREF1624_08388 [Sporothrix schenckii ATCC 58251]KJR89967.1 hypothetical protein SPSK_06367 [Sporothrix schenckii 1099-18]